MNKMLTAINGRMNLLGVCLGMRLAQQCEAERTISRMGIKDESIEPKRWQSFRGDSANSILPQPSYRIMPSPLVFYGGRK